MSNDPRVLDPDCLPTPFSAEEIRRACPPGRTMVIETRRGGELSIRKIVFGDGDEAGCASIEYRVDPNGGPDSSPEEQYSDWLDLQRHALFPRAQTTREELVADLPIGRHGCWLYVRTEGDTVTSFWFAKAFPGMPMRMTIEKAGSVVFEMLVVEDHVN